MSYVMFAGCSFTAGTGLLNEKDDPNLWVNKLSSYKKLSSLIKLNMSQAGNSNEKIFSDAVFNITKFDIKYAFIQWTSIPRMIIDVGLETYSTKQALSGNDGLYDHSLIDAEISKKYIAKVKNMLFSMIHDHSEILKLVYFTNALIQLCNKVGTKIFFINGLCTWDKNFFEIEENVSAPSQYTLYTQRLINIDLRDDAESYAIYNKMHNEYNSYGGIQPAYWLNLYNSMRSSQIDYGNDNSHPGIESNNNYAIQFYNIFEEKLNNR